MRAVRYSQTFARQLTDLLKHGVQAFGPDVTAEKRDIVLTTIENTLAAHPAIKQARADIGLVCYPVAATPFVILYDYDDDVLRVHFILHRHADIDAVDPTSVEW